MLLFTTGLHPQWMCLKPSLQAISQGCAIRKIALNLWIPRHPAGDFNEKKTRFPSHPRAKVRSQAKQLLNSGKGFDNNHSGHYLLECCSSPTGHWWKICASEFPLFLSVQFFGSYQVFIETYIRNKTQFLR